MAARWIERLRALFQGGKARGGAGGPKSGGLEGIDDDDAPWSPPEEPVEMPIEDAIDLHTFSPKETASVVEEYLEAAQARGFREVRIIHGKGKGVQRRIIQAVLGRSPRVERFADAPSTRGGWGATLAWLKPAELHDEKSDDREGRP